MWYFPTSPAYLDHGFASVIHEERLDRRSWSPSGFVPGGTIPLSEIRIGETCYPLRHPLRNEFLPVDDGTCEFWVDVLSPCFVGKAVRAHESYLDWRDRVHEAFQDLYRKRPFEMTEREQEQWRALQDAIDVVGYRNETPIVVRQIGKVSRARLPRQITWIDGKTETVALDDLPGEFASYKPGQPFEADVERDPLTWRLRKVRHVQRIHSIPPMAQAELQRFWATMPGTSSLPTSDRDWTES